MTYRFADAGTKPKIQLFYGRRDCLTFVQRDLHGTEKKGVSSELLNEDRTWESATAEQAVQGNASRFMLKNLDAGTRYFYRAIVTNEEGKSWAFESETFQTLR